MNENSGWYETFYRDYDPILGRFNQADPLANASSSLTPYGYGFNDPVFYNDPMGDYPPGTCCYSGGGGSGSGQYFGSGYTHIGPGSGDHWSDQYRSVEGNFALMSRSQFENYYGVDLSTDAGKWQAAQAMAHSPTQSDMQNIASALGAGFMGMGGNTAYFITVLKPAVYDSHGNRLADQVNGVVNLSIGVGRSELVIAQQGGPGDPPVNSGSNDGFPWATVAGGVVGNFGLGTSITLHQITKGGTQVRLAQKGAYVGAKSFSTKLGLVGVGISLVDIGANGVNTGRALDVLMGGVAFIPVVGWGISATYFVGNLITIGVTGQSIGDHIQGAITGEDGTKSWKPW